MYGTLNNHLLTELISFDSYSIAFYIFLLNMGNDPVLLLGILQSNGLPHVFFGDQMASCFLEVDPVN